MIVNAENKYGNIAPISKPANTYDSIIEILAIFYYSPALCKKPPNNDRDTNAALPIAKPLPIAAVVLPAASNPSVR